MKRIGDVLTSLSIPVGPAGSNGEEIRRRMDELIRGQGAGAEKIPGALEELARMIPC